MNEATCKAAVAKILRAELLPRGGIVYRHEDTFTGGMPDLSASLGGRSVWAEFKLDRPGKRSLLTALQRDALTRLWGLEVHYAVDRAGVLEARVTNYRTDAVLAHVRSGTKTVHRIVADTILKSLEAR